MGVLKIYTGSAFEEITAVGSVIASDESSDTTCFPLFAIEATGVIAVKTGSNLTFNSFTGAFEATTIIGANVTSGADPGHTHTGASLSLIDISDDTNLAASSGIDLTGDTLTFDSTEIDTTAWGSGSAFTWTFDASAGTDITMLFGNGQFTLSGDTGTGPMTRLSAGSPGTNPGWNATDVLVVENDSGSNTSINIFAANNKTSNVLFSDNDSRSAGSIVYDHSDNTLDLSTANTIVVTVSVGDVAISNKLSHLSDSDTHIAFTGDRMDLLAGGITFLTLVEAATDVLTVNLNMVDIDFIVNSDTGLVFKVDAGTHEALISTDLLIQHGAVLPIAATACHVGGTLNSNITEVGNVGTGEDDLMTFILEKSDLDTAGEQIEIIAYGVTASNTNSKTIKLYFGSAVLLASAADTSTGVNSWMFHAFVTLENTSVQKAIAKFVGEASLGDLVEFTGPTEDTSLNVTIKVTGEATANDDIVQEGMIVRWHNVGH